MTRPIGAPCWMDLLTSDTARAREFYGGLFGWTAGDAAEEFGGYFMFFADGATGGRLHAEGARRAGHGRARRMGRVPVFRGRQGHRRQGARARRHAARGADGHRGPRRRCHLHQRHRGADRRLAGEVLPWHQRVRPGGNTVVLRADDPRLREVRRVLHRVCGWQPEVAGDTDEFRLSVLKDSDGETIAGIMDGPASCRRTRATSGSSTSRWPTPTPRSPGSPSWAARSSSRASTPRRRLAAADPTGAPFKLVGPAGEGSA